MKLTGNQNSFDQCPAHTGKGVIIDMTPLKRVQSQYGERDVFKGVIETELTRADGSRYLVWTRPFTPTLGEKSSFRKFARGVLGRDLTREELAGFDTETLIGRPVEIIVVHEHKDGETFANILACTPDRSAEPLKPSGKYVRVKDRPPKDVAGAGQQGGYRRAEQPGSDAGDLGATKIHVGRCKGLEVRDLAPEQVQALVENWLPMAKANAKPTADDRRLIAALEWWVMTQPAADDNVPY